MECGILLLIVTDGKWDFVIELVELECVILLIGWRVGKVGVVKLVWQQNGWLSIL